MNVSSESPGGAPALGAPRLTSLTAAGATRSARCNAHPANTTESATHNTLRTWYILLPILTRRLKPALYGGLIRLIVHAQAEACATVPIRCLFVVLGSETRATPHHVHHEARHR